MITQEQISYAANIFRGMKFRCYNENAKNYHTYGGRGIYICDEWLNNPMTFYAWYLDRHDGTALQLDRINNDGPYSPENCRLVSSKINCRNKSVNRSFMAFGETKNASAWAEDPRCKVDYAALLARLDRGWEGEAALTEDVFKAPESKTENDVNNLVAFNEKKTLAEWTRDPRCKVKKSTLQYRVAAGWKLEDALTVASSIKNNDYVAPQTSSITAFGETKLATEWAEDSRCVVSLTTIWERINQNGWPPERALTEEVNAHLIKYQGKTIAEWAKDPACPVNDKTMYARLKRGWSLEKAVTTPIKAKAAK